MGENSKNSTTAAEDLFKGGGEMGERIRAFDWTQTPLGARNEWQDALGSTLSICLSSRFPMAIYWGDEGFLLYNDAWRPILGDKHPWALGRPAREVWSEIWDFIAPVFESVRATGEGTWRGDELLPMQRFGYTEECYFDYTFNPIRGSDGKIEGILNIVQETTYRVLNDRRTRLLRELAALSGSAQTEENALEMSAAAFATDNADVPFALLYLVETDARRARLIASTGLPANHPARIEEINLYADAKDGGWSLAAAFQTAKPAAIDDLTGRFGAAMPGGLWSEPTTQAIVLPIIAAGEESVSALLVAGINPRHTLDDEYHHFFELVAAYVAAALANAKAYSTEKRRAESLAEIDRAKTEFFSNVSHEFRTPLTLMLGNLEEVLQKDGQVPPDERFHIETAHRNSLRLLKLVNTLLDFSRIEANRQQADFEPTDLSKFTAELASSFRSAVEKAGIRLTVDCPPLSQNIAVDCEMWEKIVLNLISNAFKFTFEGEIKISLRETDESAVLQISDTGTGISEAELPHVFERFHRVAGAKSRTHEGTGIGLALVKELVKLHDGAISAASEIDEGTTFTVSIPKARKGSGETERKREKTAQASKAWQSYLLDLETNKATETDYTSSSAFLLSDSSPKILLADDNADMREYVRRLLEQNGYQVAAVANGEAALGLLKENKPDLILSDVMMPFLDGFGLLEKVREREKTREIPVILLSARAGEEAKVEGLEAGADDYLIKPFSAKELIARVDANLKMARLRRESAAQIERLLAGINDAFATLDKDLRYVYVNDAAVKMSEGKESKADFIGRLWADVFPEAVGTEFQDALRRAVEAGEQSEFEYFYPVWKRWYETRTYPTESGGVSLFVADITGRKRAEESLRESNERTRQALAELQATYDQSPVGMLQLDTDLRYVRINDELAAMNGIPAEQHIGKTIWEIVPDLSPKIEAAFRRVIETGEPVLDFELTGETAADPGAAHTWLESWFPLKDADGKVVGLNIVAQDITERKRAEEKMRESEERFRKMADHAPVMIWVTEPDGNCIYLSQSWYQFTGQTPETAFGFGWLDATHPGDAEEAGRIFLAANEKREAFRLEYRLRRKDGEYRWAIDSAQPRFSETGEFLGYIGSVIDISERKAAEEKLRFLSELNQTLLSLTEPDEIMATTAQMLGEFLAVNRCAYAEVEADENHFNLTGNYTHETFSIVGYLAFESFGEEVLRLMRANEAYVVNDVENDSRTAGFLDAYHQTDIASVICLPLHKNGKFTAAMAVHQKTPRVWKEEEIELVQLVVNRCWESLERARTDKKLRQAEERFRLLTENAEDYAIIFLDAEARIISWNVGAERILGYKEDEVIGLFGDFIFTPEDRENKIPEKELETAKAKGDARDERWHLRKDGSRFFAFGEMIALRAEAGDLRGYAKMFRDLTERKQAEEALSDSKARFDIVKDSAQVGFWFCDLPFDVLVWDNRVKEHFWLPPDALVTIDTFYEQLHPDDRGRTRQAIEESIANKTQYEIEYRTVSDDGQERWIRAVGRTFYDAQDNPIRFDGVTLDITAAKKAETERERLLKREQELRLAAETANRLKDEFLATVSHELRTPLNAILGWSSMLQAGRVDEETRRRADETIYRSAKSQAQLIEDLLDVSRIISGNLRIQSSSVNLASLIESSIETLRPAAQAKSIELEISIECEPCRINGDAQRLQQIVWNLVSNAVKFTPDGGRIAVRLEKDNSRARLTVEDSGKGIEAEFLPYIFERFRQADGSTTRRHGGLGLGLAIVRNLTELHGGTISAASAGAGQGATFIVELPLISTHEEINENSNNQREPVSDEAAVQASKSLEGVRVLLVDDELDTLELLDAVLTAEGAEVRVAASAQEAFEIFEMWQPDLLISDIGMPIEDGYALIKKVRQLPSNKGGITPAIAMTAYGRDEDRMRVLASGFHQYLAKPAEPFELVKVINNLIGKNIR